MSDITPLGFSVTARTVKDLKAKKKDELAGARKALANAYGDTVSARTAAGKKPKLAQSAEDAFKSLSKKDREALKKHTKGPILLHVTEGDAAIDKSAKLLTIGKNGKVKKIKGNNSRKEVLRSTAFKKGNELKKRAKTAVYDAEKHADRSQIMAAAETVKKAAGKAQKQASAMIQNIREGKGMGALAKTAEKLIKHLEKFVPALAETIRKAIPKVV